jgi:hypothetical protein
MKILLACAALVLVSATAMAASKPFNLSLAPCSALYDRSETIDGMTLSIWGENPQHAFALGFVNGATGDSAGMSLGLLYNYAENYTGVQWGLVNCTQGDFCGWQDGIANHVGGTLRGLQTGIANCAMHLSGVQVGLVNYAKEAEGGVQIGLVNILAGNNGWFTGMPKEVAPAMVLVNWRF